MNKKYFDIVYKKALKAYQLNEVPIGAVIVKNDKIIATAYNTKEKDDCCISHAEIKAVTKASKKLGNWRLNDCELYVSIDPCPMCASAIKQSRIKKVYSGLNNSDPNNLLLVEKIFKKDSVNPSVFFESNLDVERSRSLLNSFFEKQRNS